MSVTADTDIFCPPASRLFQIVLIAMLAALMTLLVSLHPAFMQRPGTLAARDHLDHPKPGGLPQSRQHGTAVDSGIGSGSNAGDNARVLYMLVIMRHGELIGAPAVLQLAPALTRRPSCYTRFV